MVAVATDQLTRPAWAVAAVAAMSILAHIWMLAFHAHGVALTVLMIAMTLWCAWCAVEALLRPSVHCLQRLLLMSLAMVAVHTMMIVVPAQAGSGGHAHHQGADTAAPGTAITAADGHASAMLAIIAIEFLVAVACALSLRRRRSPQAFDLISENHTANTT
ncbi:MAG: hypothetical protein ACTHWO_11430 [Nesterenkonia sp.]